MVQSTVAFVAIDQVLEAAQAFDVKNRAPMTDLRSVAEGLFDELEREHADYLLVGGLALLAYIEGRNTQDVDLIVDPGVVSRLPWHGRILDHDFAEAAYRGIHVDLLLTSNPVFRHVATSERASLMFGHREIPCASRGGMLLLKLYALPSLYRQGKFARVALYEADIRMLLLDAEVDMAGIFALLEGRMLATDVAELRTIVRELTKPRAF